MAVLVVGWRATNELYSTEKTSPPGWLCACHPDTGGYDVLLHDVYFRHAIDHQRLCDYSRIVAQVYMYVVSIYVYLLAGLLKEN